MNFSLKLQCELKICKQRTKTENELHIKLPTCKLILDY